MKRRNLFIAAGLLVATSLSTANVQAGGLLSLGGNDEALINLDLGSGSHTGVDASVNLGSSHQPTVTADVELGGSNSLLAIDADIANQAIVDADVLKRKRLLTLNTDVRDTADVDFAIGGRDESLVDLGINIGARSVGGGNDGGGGGNNSNGIGGVSGTARVAIGGDSDAVIGANCSPAAVRQIVSLVNESDYTRGTPAQWQQAANVQIVPISICAEARREIAADLNLNGTIGWLRGAAAADALITASLSRTRYDINDVVAVDRKGGLLTVYVY